MNLLLIIFHPWADFQLQEGNHSSSVLFSIKDKKKLLAQSDSCFYAEIKKKNTTDDDDDDDYCLKMHKR